MRAVTALATIAFVSGVSSANIDCTLCPEVSALNPAPYIIATSMLLCLKESNYVIRWFFNRHRLMDKIKDAPQTENGRIIGNLERLLLMIFLWQGAPLAATFIVAVKGLARFKKMEEDQAFAEYVVIGTFLSVLLTLAIYYMATWITSNTLP